MGDTAPDEAVRFPSLESVLGEGEPALRLGDVAPWFESDEEEDEDEELLDAADGVVVVDGEAGLGLRNDRLTPDEGEGIFMTCTGAPF